MARLALMTVAILSKDWGDPSNHGFRDRIETTVKTLEGVDDLSLRISMKHPSGGDLFYPMR